MNIEIDYREHDIISLFKNEDPKLVKFRVCNLIIGDFIIKNDIGELLFVIERKTVKDLCASIVDSRWSEQRSRLLESVGDPEKIMYIIEGKKEEHQGITKKTINSSILNLMIKHKYRVVFTDSKQDTLENILLLYNKMKDNNLKPDHTAQITKLIKKSDKINNHIFVNMLSIIPGVSTKIAIKIHEKYDTFIDLIGAYNSIESELDKKKLLSEIQVSANRKVGKAVSEKIYFAVTAQKDKHQNLPVNTIIHECLL